MREAHLFVSYAPVHPFSPFSRRPVEPQKYPINGILDLHQFNPSEVGELVPEYVRACRKKDIYRVRIIHGKGTGALRRSVHALLDDHPHVIRYETAKDASSWGATIAYLEEGEPE